MIHISPRITDQLRCRNVAAVRAALQAAIELEHATIPPYLYALYSLVPGTNTAVARIIESVVREEMLHLTLSANILNALGGIPILDSRTFIPKFPGPLPGSVENELIVGLEPFSLDLVQNVFMIIEEPEFSIGAVGTSHLLTIGQFYGMIRNIIEDLDAAVFANPPRHQVTPEELGAIAVIDKKTALQAIDTIIDQGEGTAKSPLEKYGKDYAHYYRFKEVLEGHYFKRNPYVKPNDPPDKQYIHSDKTIPIDFAGILQVPNNPTMMGYPNGSAARKACISFNYTYTGLLKSLHLTFNGKPGNFAAVLGLMMSLKHQAIDMMSGTTTAGIPTGPTFEWQPVDREPSSK